MTSDNLAQGPTLTVEPEGIVTVNGTTVEAVGVGAATLTASGVGLNGETVEATVEFTVAEAPTLSLNRTEWWIDPNLAYSETHGACYLQGSVSGGLSERTVTWRMEPAAGPRLLIPVTNDAGDLPDPETFGNPYEEPVVTPYATPTKIRWVYAPEWYDTDVSSIEWPVSQTAVMVVNEGGAVFETSCVIEIRDPAGS